MRFRNLLLLAGVAALGSCTSVYKSGQTPDDVYYSPAKAGLGYVATNDNSRRSNEEYVDMNDRYLRMKTYNYNRWSTFDDDYMYWNDNRWNNPYYFSYYSSPYYNPIYSPISWYTGIYYSPWNNPFCPIYYGQPIVVLKGQPSYRNPLANGPRTFNLNTYTRSQGSYDSHFGRKYYNTSTTGGSYVPVRSFNNSGSGMNNSSSGGRKLYTPSQPEQRSYSPPRSSGSSSGSSGSSNSGSSPTRTFKRGG